MKLEPLDRANSDEPRLGMCNGTSRNVRDRFFLEGKSNSVQGRSNLKKVAFSWTFFSSSFKPFC